VRSTVWCISALLFLLPLHALASTAEPADAPPVLDPAEAANERRIEAIEQLAHTLVTHGERMDAATRGEALFRLGDLQWEHSRAMVGEAMVDLDRRWERWLGLSKAEQEEAGEPRPDLSVSRHWSRQAARSWQDLTRELPDHPRAPEAWLFTAICLDELGHPEQALNLREQFVVRWPDHALAGEAMTGIGEYHFDRDRPHQALRAFELAAEHTDSRTYPLALYRIGWCWYQLGDLEAARQSFVGLLREGQAQRRRGEAEAIPLQDETLRILTTVYAELRAVDRARSELGDLVPEQARAQLERVGQVLAEQGETDLAISTWSALIEQAPLAPDNPALQGRVVSALWAARRYDEAARATAEMAERFGDGSAWAAAGGSDPASRRTAEGLLERKLRDVALGTHREAVASRSSDLMLLAEQCYEHYLGMFPRADGAYEVRFWYAEALFSLAKYDRAADEYDRVVAADPQGRHLRDAAAGSIYSVERHLEELGVSQGR
jgi:tetratricopeptide (TPR) repeat protein